MFKIKCPKYSSAQLVFLIFNSMNIRMILNDLKCKHKDHKKGSSLQFINSFLKIVPKFDCP